MERKKAQYYCKRAEEELQQRNYLKAREWYSRCLAFTTNSQDACIALTGRSSTFTKCGRAEEGLQDATSVLEKCPNSVLGHTRKAEALYEMNEYWMAAQSYAAACKFEQKKDGYDGQEARIRHCISRMDVQDISTTLCELLGQSTKHKLLRVASTETLTAQEFEQAAYKAVSESVEGKSSLLDYRTLLFHWLRVGVHSAALYAYRSRVYCLGGNLAQAHDDALSSLEALKVHEKAKVQCLTSKDLRKLKSLACFVFGESLSASQNDSNKDICDALEWYRLAKNFDDSSEIKIQEKINECMYHAYMTQSDPVVQPVLCSYRPTTQQDKRVIEAVLRLADLKTRVLDGVSRNQLRQAVAGALKVSLCSVTLESVKYLKEQENSFRCIIHAEVNDDAKTIDSFQTALQEITNVKSFCGEANLEKVALIERPTVQVDLIASSPEKTRSAENIKEPERQSSCKVGYQLVLSNGKRAPQRTRHVFALTRLLFEPPECRDEVWAEMLDGSCRWRQSAMEIKLLALKVPKTIKRRLLAVTLTTTQIQIYNTQSREMYLDGFLSKNILPEESYWTFEKDVFMLILKKMNLDILNNGVDVASQSWWSHLFEGHEELEWDDYDKDLTDLPDHLRKNSYATYLSQSNQGKTPFSLIK